MGTAVAAAPPASRGSEIRDWRKGPRRHAHIRAGAGVAPDSGPAPFITLSRRHLGERYRASQNQSRPLPGARPMTLLPSRLAAILFAALSLVAFTLPVPADIPAGHKAVEARNGMVVCASPPAAEVG